MSRNILVSIITPCLNSEKTIRDTISSVLNQSYNNIEYIIVDGGSKDSTLEIIEEYIPLFCGRMRYISEEDQGIYNAMNKGIRLSHGQLIGIINSDDFYEKNAIQLAVGSMTDDRYQLIYGYCRILDKHDRTISVNRVSHRDVFAKTFQHPTCFVTRKTYCRYGLFHEHYKVAADCDLIYRLYRNNVKFIQVREVIANYRLGGYSSQTNHEIELELIKYLNGGTGIQNLIGKLVKRLIWGGN